MDKDIQHESVTIVKNISSSAPVLKNENEKEAFETTELMNNVELINIKQEKDLGCKRYLGLFYVLLSVNFQALSSIVLKLIGRVDPLNLITFSFSSAAILGVFFIWYAVKIEGKSVTQNVLPLGKNKKVHSIIWLVGILKVVAVFVHICAFQYISVADTRTIVMASVITIYFFGWICFGEKCGVVPIITAVVALCGIGVMTRPPILTGAKEFNMETLMGVSYAFAGMIFSTMLVLSFRSLQNVHSAVVNTVLHTWACIFTLPIALALGKVEIPESNWDLVGMIGVGVLWQLSVTCLVVALQTEEAGVVSLIKTSEVVFNFLWQMVFLNVYPDFISLVGAALVMSGVIVVTLRKWVTSFDKETKLRKRLAFLLK